MSRVISDAGEQKGDEVSICLLDTRREVWMWHFKLFLNSDAHCCHMGTAIKYPVSDWVNPSFLIFDIRAL